jgi:hypothetical protein
LSSVEVDLVVEVVEQGGHAPQLLVVAVMAGVPAPEASTASA